MFLPTNTAKGTNDKSSEVSYFRVSVHYRRRRAERPPGERKVAIVDVSPPWTPVIRPVTGLIHVNDHHTPDVPDIFDNLH